MKNFLTLIFISILGLVQAQEITYVKLDFSCEAGIKAAKADLDNGIYKVLSYGLILWKEPELREFHIEFVREKYGVILGDGGCVISEKSKCYTEEMKNAVLEKYGEDFFEKSLEEAKLAFKSLSN